MVKKVLNIFNREFGTSQAAMLLAVFAFLAQILGLVRDRSLAHFIGPSTTLDIYYAAFRVPDFIYVVVASLVSITVLIPFLMDKMNKGEGNEVRAKKFLNDIFSVFLLFIIAVSIVAFLSMPWIAHNIAPGFKEESYHHMIILSRIMLLSPILLGISNLIGCVTQIFGKFFIFALSPLFYNLGIVFGIVFLYPRMGLYGLGLGVVLGAILHLLIQVPAIIKSKLIPKFSLNIDWSEVKKVITVSLPRTLGLSLNNLALIAIISFASFMKEGSISIFNLSFGLQSVPVTVIGLSYAVASFPSLVKQFNQEYKFKFIEHLTFVCRQIIFWSLPATLLFIVLRAQIVRVVLGSGSFSWANTRLTAAALALFAVSLLAQNLILTLVRGYYAASNTRRPLLINFISSVLIIIFAQVLIYLFNAFPLFRYFMESLFRISDIPGTEIIMLPLAYSLGTILNLILLLYFFKKDFSYLINAECSPVRSGFLRKNIFKNLASSLIMGYVAYIFLGIFARSFNLETFWGIFGQGFFAGIVGILAGIVVLKLLGSPELDSTVNTIKSKFWKAKVVIPIQQDL